MGVKCSFGTLSSLTELLFVVVYVFNSIEGFDLLVDVLSIVIHIFILIDLTVLEARKEAEHGLVDIILRLL